MGAILVREVALRLIQMDLENHYGLLLVLAFAAFQIGRRTRPAQLYCLGGGLVVLVYLTHS